MATYLLLFDATGRTSETFTVPAGKAVYLVRAPQVSAGTATVTDLLTFKNYTLPDGVTVGLTSIPSGATVTLAFMARTNPNVSFINVEVITPRAATACS
ncbi:MAG: hypothetical protein HQL82_08945 [Magnetococcales bacterium]|nr:hypothetical protein [Magnetococcales bacterium]